MKVKLLKKSIKSNIYLDKNSPDYWSMTDRGLSALESLVAGLASCKLIA
jgi:hypothetical protein